MSGVQEHSIFVFYVTLKYYGINYPDFYLMIQVIFILEFFANIDTTSNPKIQFGCYIEKLFTDPNYYSTRLPRIPLLIEKSIFEKLKIYKLKRKILAYNKNIMQEYIEGSICFVISPQVQ